MPGLILEDDLPPDDEKAQFRPRLFVAFVQPKPYPAQFLQGQTVSELCNGLEADHVFERIHSREARTAFRVTRPEEIRRVPIAKLASRERRDSAYLVGGERKEGCHNGILQCEAPNVIGWRRPGYRLGRLSARAG